MIILTLPANGQASVLFFVNNLFASTKTSETIPEVVNSQRMTLLEPTLNSDPSPIKRNSHLAIEDGALVAESGPTGGATEVFNDNSSSDKISLYTVRDGDSLPSIAKLFGVSVNTILWANDLKKGVALKKDQVLTILPVSGVKYTVKKGDTLLSIAKQFKGDQAEIVSFNSLSDGQSLTPGDGIIIPNGEIGSPVTPSSKSKSSGSPKKIYIGGSVGLSLSFSGPHTDSTNFMRPPLNGGVRTQGLHGHNGVDWGAPVGTPIYSVASGSVLISKNNGSWNGGYGDYVVISHSNGTQSLYAHMQSTTVGVGSQVEKGQVIGYVGMTGETSGPHVHFEIRGGRNPF